MKKLRKIFTSLWPPNVTISCPGPLRDIQNSCSLPLLVSKQLRVKNRGRGGQVTGLLGIFLCHPAEPLPL